MRRAKVDIPNDWPWLCETGCCGPFYTKQVAGGDFQLGQDILQDGGYGPQSIIAQMWLAMALGASGVRVYGLDSFWFEERADAPIGQKDLQTGARPGDERWPGVSVGLSAIAKYESLLLGQFLPPIFVDQWVIGRRDGFTWYVNCSEQAQIPPIAGQTMLVPTGETLCPPVVPAGAVVLSIE